MYICGIFVEPITFSPDCVLKGTHWKIDLPLEEDCAQMMVDLREQADKWNVAVIAVTTPDNVEEYAGYGFLPLIQNTEDTVIMGLLPRINWEFH